MRLRAIFCAALSAGCASDAPPRLVSPPPIPADLLREVLVTCPEPRVESDIARCLIRLRAGLGQANGRLAAIREITGPR